MRIRNSLIDIYDSFALTYEQNRNLFDMSDVISDFFSFLGNKKGHLLDLGCGAGEPFARSFLDNGWYVSGVDFSSKMVQLAMRYVPEMKIYHTDMRTVNFPKSKFNAIIAIYSLFHLPRNDQKVMLEKIYSWLKPNGFALFTYACKEYTGKEEFDGFIDFMGKKLFYSHYSPEKLHSILLKTGFNFVEKKYRRIGGETFLWVTVQKQ